MAYKENNATKPSWGLDLAEFGKRCYLKEYIISISADVVIIGKVRLYREITFGSEIK